MNKHFEDTLYYVKRAGETAKKGVAEELAPIEDRLRELTGREKEPEQGRMQELAEDLEELQERAEGEAKEAIVEARERVRAYRQKAA